MSVTAKRPQINELEDTNMPLATTACMSPQRGMSFRIYRLAEKEEAGRGEQRAIAQCIIIAKGCARNMPGKRDQFGMARAKRSR
jgi:hypothetical protein